jgi:hypothetical protein
MVDVQKKVIRALDSMQGDSSVFLRNVLRYVVKVLSPTKAELHDMRICVSLGT